MGFFRKKPEPFKKERSLDDTYIKPRSFDNNNIEDNDQAIIEELFSTIKEDINLGNELLALFEEKCRATHIPVPEEMQNVRAAVKRKDSAEPNGSRISFALFLTSVKKYEELKLQYFLTIQDTISENPELSAVKKTELKHKVVNGISAADLLIFSSLWLLNYTATKYQEIFTIPTLSQIATAGDSGNPGAVVAGAAKMVYAIAFAAFIDAIYSDTDGSEISSETEMVNPEELSRTERLAVEKISENDYDVILDYAVRYIYSTTDQKYDPWISYLTVRKSRNSSVDMYAYYPTYSKAEFLRLNVTEDSGYESSSDSDYATSTLKERFEQNFEDAMHIKTAFNGSDTDSMYRRISARNRMVFNTAAQASAYKLTKDQICCFVRILTRNGVDRRTIKMMRCIIKAASKTLSASLFMGFSDKFLSEIKSLDIGALLINRIKGVLSNIMTRIFNKFVSRLDNAMTNDISDKCSLFNNTLDSLIDSLDDIVSNIQKQFSLESARLQRSLQNSELTLQTKYQIRMLNDIELILAAILDQSLEECALLDDDVAEEILDEFISGFNVPSNQYTIDISDEMREKYFSNSQPIRLAKKSSSFGRRSKITIPAIDKFNSPETSEEVVRNILKTCKVDLTDSQIKQMLKDTDGSSR